MPLLSNICLRKKPTELTLAQNSIEFTVFGVHMNGSIVCNLSIVVSDNFQMNKRARRACMLKRGRERGDRGEEDDEQKNSEKKQGENSY